MPITTLPLHQERISSSLGEVVYRQNTHSKGYRIIWEIVSWIVFPIGIARTLHWLASLVIFPRSKPGCKEYVPIKKWRKEGGLLDPKVHARGFRFERIAIEVEGNRIDTLLARNTNYLQSRRWTLYSLGNGEHYEERVFPVNGGPSTCLDFLEKTSSHALFYNYPGVGASEGTATLDNVRKTHQAMIHFLESRADQFIHWGYSIGGAVQGAVSYRSNRPSCYIKDRTFSHIKRVKRTGRLASFVGFNMNPERHAVTLKAPQIVLQTATIDKGRVTLHHDGVISAEASLAKPWLEERKPFLNIEEMDGPNPQLFVAITPKTGHGALTQKQLTKVATAVNKIFAT